jgi:hypothetical protein
VKVGKRLRLGVTGPVSPLRVQANGSCKLQWPNNTKS